MFNPSPCGSLGITPTAPPGLFPSGACPSPCPLRGLLWVPVAVVSEHAHPVMPILHITFLFVSLNRVL